VAEAFSRNSSATRVGVKEREQMYIRCARFGSNSNEWISTHTDRVLRAEIVGQSGVRHQWTHMSFMHEPVGLFPVEH
jgi:hypothetical protein